MSQPMMESRTVLVTGVTGYLGSRLVPRLHDDWKQATLHAIVSRALRPDRESRPDMNRGCRDVVVRIDSFGIGSNRE